MVSENFSFISGMNEYMGLRKEISTPNTPHTCLKACAGDFGISQKGFTKESTCSSLINNHESFANAAMEKYGHHPKSTGLLARGKIWIKVRKRSFGQTFFHCY